MVCETKIIKVSSRASVQIKNNFYTVEYGEERAVSDATDSELEAERERLWTLCNSEVDNQIREIVTTFK